jgi:hypothetical protein
VKHNRMLEYIKADEQFIKLLSQNVKRGWYDLPNTLSCLLLSLQPV